MVGENKVGMETKGTREHRARHLVQGKQPRKHHGTLPWVNFTPLSSHPARQAGRRRRHFGIVSKLFFTSLLLFRGYVKFRGGCFFLRRGTEAQRKLLSVPLCLRVQTVHREISATQISHFACFEVGEQVYRFHGDRKHSSHFPAKFYENQRNCRKNPTVRPVG